MTTVQNNLIEPLEVDCSFKYKCYNCGANHWLYLREANAEGFFVVCFCNEKLYVKQIKRVEIIFEQQNEFDNSKKQINNKKNVSNRQIKKCIDSIKKLGYTLEEAKKKINLAINKNPNANDIDLIKLALLEKIDE